MSSDTSSNAFNFNWMAACIFVAAFSKRAVLDFLLWAVSCESDGLQNGSGWPEGSASYQWFFVFLCVKLIYMVQTICYAPWSEYNGFFDFPNELDLKNKSSRFPWSYSRYFAHVSRWWGSCDIPHPLTCSLFHLVTAFHWRSCRLSIISSRREFTTRLSVQFNIIEVSMKLGQPRQVAGETKWSY